MKRNKSKMTLDKLAGMVANGFELTATKEDLKELATKEELKEMSQKTGNIEKDVAVVKMDLEEVKHGLVKANDRIDEVYEILARFEEGDILDLQKRIKILERAVRALGKQIT